MEETLTEEVEYTTYFWPEEKCSFRETLAPTFTAPRACQHVKGNGTVGLAAEVCPPQQTGAGAGRVGVGGTGRTSHLHGHGKKRMGLGECEPGSHQGMVALGHGGTLALGQGGTLALGQGRTLANYSLSTNYSSTLLPWPACIHVSPSQKLLQHTHTMLQ